MATSIAPSLFRSLSTSFPRASHASKFITTERCRRWYSIHADAASATKLAEIDPSKLSITKSTTPKDLLPPEELVFGRTFTGTSPDATSKPSCAHLFISSRSYALSRMDSITRMAAPSDNAVPESQSRSRHLRLPLRLRVLRGHEGLRRLNRPGQAVPTRQEHDQAEQVFRTDSTAHIRRRSFHEPYRRAGEAGQALRSHVNTAPLAQRHRHKEKLIGA